MNVTAHQILLVILKASLVIMKCSSQPVADSYSSLTVRIDEIFVNNKLGLGFQCY